MVNLVETRETVANLVAGVERGLRAYSYVPDKPEPPCVVVYPAAEQYVDFHESFDGATRVRLRLLLLLPATADRQTQEQVDRLLSSGTGDSLVDMLETDATIMVRDVSHLGKVVLEPDTQTWCYAAELTVEVLAFR